jgi:hypothetical protein
MKAVTYVDSTTGAVKRVAHVSNKVYALPFESATELRLDGIFPDAQYWYDLELAAFVAKADNPATIDRTSIASDGIDAATISGIPVGSVAVVGGFPPITVVDGTLVITSDDPGGMIIQLTHLQYLAKTFTLEVV